MNGEIQLWKSKELKTVLKISQAISQTLDLKKILKMACRMTAQALKAERCSIGLLNNTKDIHEIVHTFRKKLSYPSIDGVKFKILQYPHIAQKTLHGKIAQLFDHDKSLLTKQERALFKYLNLKVFLTVPIIVNGEPIGAFHISRLEEPSPFSSSEINLCRTIANQAGVAIKNAGLLEELKESHRQLEKQFEEQNILLEISKALSQTLELKNLFGIVTKKAADLLGIDRCAVILLDEAKESLTFHKIYSGGKHRPEYEGLQRKFEDYPELIKHLKKTHIFYTLDVSGSSLSTKEKKLFEKDGIKSLLVIPFFLAKKVLGLLALSTLKEYHNFVQSEVKLSQAIANQLSVAIESSRLMELTKNHAKELEKLSLRIIDAQEEERKNIAGRLHDVIAQDLTAIRFDLKMCQQTLPQPCTRIKEMLKECEELTSQNLENIRDLTTDLRPPVLDHFGLPSAIRWYVGNFRRRTGLKIFLRISDKKCKFTTEFVTTVYRMIQEGLTNIAKHSKATQASIFIYQKGDNARIIIQDNGVGFESEKLPYATGFGLFRLRENAELLGGKLKLISKRGRGTKLDITLPCQRRKIEYDKDLNS